MGAGLALKLLGIAGALKRAAGRLLGWLFERPSRLVAAVLLVALAAHFLVIDPGLRRDRDVARGAVQILAQRAVAEKRAHQQTKAVYRAAQLEAARLERARLERVTAQQQEITDEVVTDYRRRLADARGRAEQLRGELARAGEPAAGAGGTVHLPAAGDAAGGADAPAGHSGFPEPTASGYLRPEEIDWRLTATEQALQLDALITWVERQARVEVNGLPGDGE